MIDGPYGKTTMFGSSYFSKSYFGSSYFGQKSHGPYGKTTMFGSSYFGKSYFGSSYFGQKSSDDSYDEAIYPPSEIIQVRPHKSLRVALYEILRSHVLLADIIGDRVYPGHLPHRPELPSVVFSVVSDERWRNLNEPAGSSEARFRVECYSEIYDDADLCRKHVNALMLSLMQDHDGIMVDGFSFRWVHQMPDFDDTVRDIEGKAGFVHRIVTDYNSSYDYY